ncbi:MAG: hypothetical protein HPY70_14895 [Firmicutes bacterium]|nr:hypothetical protein [Bacillota bacterium]
MQRIVQIMTLMSVSLLFENVMKVMGQKELGSVMKICAWVICAAWALAIFGDMAVWLHEKLTWIGDMFIWLDEKIMFIENLFDWGK